MNPGRTFHQLLERDGAGSRRGQYSGTHAIHPIKPIALVIPGYSLNDTPRITEPSEKSGPPLTESSEKSGGILSTKSANSGVTNYPPPAPADTDTDIDPLPPHHRRVTNNNHRSNNPRSLGVDYDYGLARLMMEFGRLHDPRDSVLTAVRPDDLESVVVMDASALMSAAGENRMEVVKLLISYNANVDIQNNKDSDLIDV